MADKTLQQVNIELRSVKREVKNLRLLLVGLVSPNHDPEGEYRPEFVRHILSRARSSRSVKQFKNTTSFLKDLDEV